MLTPYYLVAAACILTSVSAGPKKHHQSGVRQHGHHDNNDLLGIDTSLDNEQDGNEQDGVLGGLLNVFDVFDDHEDDREDNLIARQATRNTKTKRRKTKTKKPKTCIPRTV